MDLNLDNIQGNIVPGFNKDHQAFVLIRFRGSQAGARWLGELQPLLTSANEVEGFRIAFKSAKRRRSPESSPGRDGGALRSISATWTNVAISFAGLQVLAAARDVSRFPQTFRSNRVPGVDQPEGIAEAHALLIVAADHLPNLDAELERQRQQMAACGVDELAAFRGDTLPGDQIGHEHFGFKDGISQPSIVGTSWGSGPHVAAGEFILGQPDQTGQLSGAGLPAWTQNGSFLAFVQLQQHVPTFWKTMRQQAQQFRVEPEDVAAWIVGRKADADGTLLADPPTRVSHIGRANARWLPANESLLHRFLRRGIPYGQPWKDGEPDDDQRGLLFVAYQADLERQFEFVWTHWLNATGFPIPGAGRDALVGQVNWPNASPAGGVRPALTSRPGQIGDLVNLSLPAFVTPRYGAYYFAPGIDALSRLTGGTQATAQVPGS